MCFDERKTPVNCITLFSIVVTICAIIMVVFAYLGTQGETLDTLKQAKSMEDLDSTAALLAVWFFLLSALILVVAILGFCFRCCKNRCYAMCYGVTVLPVWILLLIGGGIAVSVALASQEDIEKYCKDLSKKIADTQSDDKTSITFDLNIYESFGVNTYMCTQNCPCDSGAKGGWMELTQKELDETYNAPERKAGILGNFVFLAVTDQSGMPKYQSYAECITATGQRESKVATKYETQEFVEFANAFYKQSDYADIESYLKFFEDTYTCAGICEPALFYFTRSIKDGMPPNSCLESISDEMKTSLLGVGGAALASGIFIFFTFLFQYCLWRKYEDDD